MRTNVSLDDDVYRFAQMYARAKGITLSLAVSELLRRAQDVQPAAPEVQRSAITGLAAFPPSGKALTSKMVRDAESDLE